MLSFCLVSIILRLSFSVGLEVISSSLALGNTAPLASLFGNLAIARFLSCHLAGCRSADFFELPVVGVVGAEAAGFNSPIDIDNRSSLFISLSMLSLADRSPRKQVKFFFWYAWLNDVA